MVSVYTLLTATVVGLISVADALSLGTYFRPPTALVSGVPGNATKALYRRTPCPALNALANHGFLPRDGKNIGNQQLRDAVMDKFNLDLALASFLVSVLPPVFDLNLLGTHGLIEHDASLIHADSAFGADPSLINQGLLKDVLSRGNDATPFSVETFGKLRKERIAACKANNPSCTFGPRETFLAFGESSLILQGFGNATTETAQACHVKAFLQYEKFPADFKKPQLITQASLGATSAKIQAIAASGP